MYRPCSSTDSGRSAECTPTSKDDDAFTELCTSYLVYTNGTLADFQNDRCNSYRRSDCTLVHIRRVIFSSFSSASLLLMPLLCVRPPCRLLTCINSVLASSTVLPCFSLCCRRQGWSDVPGVSRGKAAQAGERLEPRAYTSYTISLVCCVPPKVNIRALQLVVVVVVCKVCCISTVQVVPGGQSHSVLFPACILLLGAGSAILLNL